MSKGAPKRPDNRAHVPTIGISHFHTPMTGSATKAAEQFSDFNRISAGLSQVVQ